MRTVYSVSIAVPDEHLGAFQKWLNAPGDNIFGASILSYSVLAEIPNVDRCDKTDDLFEGDKA